MTDAAQKVRAMIVDDDSIMRELISYKLTQLNVDVVGEAENGVDAISEFERLNPDLVLLDIQIPKKNGLQVLKTIIEMNPKARVVMLTANSDTNVAQSCIHQGALDFINKSVGLGDFDKTLTPILKPIDVG